MAFEHRTRPLFGVQFHPESVLTESGHRLLANFLPLAGIGTADLPLGDFPAKESAQQMVTSTAEGTPLHW